ncbi:hypothetical protein Tco_0965107 [Tanacetum coccineum]
MACISRHVVDGRDIQYSQEPDASSRDNLYGSFRRPGVIVTDRELALMNAYDTAFPNAKGLLSWNTLIIITATEALFGGELNMDINSRNCIRLSGVIVYLNKYWLTQYKERFLAAWTEKFPHFRNQTTNRVESQHAKLKLYLDSAQSDLLTAVSYIHEVVNSQETAIHSIDILFEEYTLCVDGLGSEICECQLRTSYGLPCSHEQLVYMNKGYPIPLEAIDRFWRKLNLSPCASLGDDDLDSQVKVEVENFNTEFKKQSRAGSDIFFENGFAPIEKWMNMPEIAVFVRFLPTVGMIQELLHLGLNVQSLCRMDYSVLRADKLFQSTASLKLVKS